MHQNIVKNHNIILAHKLSQIHKPLNKKLKIKIPKNNKSHLYEIPCKNCKIVHIELTTQYLEK